MIAVVMGLGEAGKVYSAGLAGVGWTVRAYDPADVDAPDVVTRCSTVAEAVPDADLVISLTGASAAYAAAESAAPHLSPMAVFADLNTTTPELKRRIHSVVTPSGALMTDIAVLAAVPLHGLQTPLIACGEGAPAAASALRGAGVPVEVIDGPAGAAAERKLIRSVFAKGLAGLTLEGLAAARAAGCEEWMRDQIAEQLGPRGHQVVDRLVEGTHLHAERRYREMAESRQVLVDHGVPTHICDATLEWLQIVNAAPKVGL